MSPCLLRLVLAGLFLAVCARSQAVPSAVLPAGERKISFAVIKPTPEVDIALSDGCTGCDKAYIRCMDTIMKSPKCKQECGLTKSKVEKMHCHDMCVLMMCNEDMELCKSAKC